MIIDTKNGKIQGIEFEDYVLFKGVPYAKPPVGNLRFEAPEPLENWEGVLKCDTWPDKAIQADFTDPNEFYYKEFYWNEEFNVKQSEDCLYLNVWMPKTDKKNLPVAMFIHGGAFDHGYASEMEFDGEAFCKKDVILISIQYRVGVWGFLSHPWLSKTSGNNGILDQIAALNWIYDNAECFNGDKDNITVFGQSAGCMSTQVLISTPLTGNKIARAILQSASGYKGGLSTNRSMEDALSLGNYFVNLLGVNNLEELKALPNDVLFSAQKDLQMYSYTHGYGLPFNAVTDGIVLNDTYDSIIENGKLKRIPYMLGSVEDEIDKKPPFVAQHPCEEGVVNWSLKLEELWNEPSFVYLFKHRFKPDNQSAYHSSELWYMFGTYTRSSRPMDEKDACLSEEMVSAWTNFCKNGDPGFSPCTKDNPFVKIFE